jgi:alpha-1,3-fucosyltransferase
VKTDIRIIQTETNNSTADFVIRVLIPWFRHSFPPYRFEDQPWVYMQRESPIYTNLTLKDYPNVFNWTMTYRKDSDIHFPYGAVKFFPSANVAQFDYELENSLFMKKADEVEAAWTVSHCSTQSKREELVKKLKKYISIDVYGVCGKNKCKKKNEEDGCHEELETKYKFYLSFENSMCEEYVTEKFFNVLNRSMIPVVYGYEDYSSIAPPGSFIDARSFKSVEELGKYLKFLSGNVTEYLKYFEWKKHYQVILGPTNEMWCGLCHKILENRVNGWKKKQWYANIHDWWNQSSSLLNSLDQDIIVRPSSKFSSNDSLLSFDFLTSNFNHRETVEDYPRSACVPPSTF